MTAQQESSPAARVLLAEDEVTIAVTLKDELEDAGYEVLAAEDTASALRLLDEADPDLVLTDIRMPGEGGMAVLQRSMELDSTRPVVIMTGYATVDQAVEAMRIGARHYVQKPFANEAMVQIVGEFSRLRLLERENRALRERLGGLEAFDGLVGSSAPMIQVLETIRTVAPTEVNVLIQGESGTGKERVALALHKASARAQGPFVATSCAALPETLLEAELFGHEKGAFTDAHKEKLGRFEQADGGTFFLDDIDDMPKTMQVKLLRVLQERSFERLGGEITRRVDIRVVAATKVPLRDEVRAGRFREDLYYRINVVPLLLPPLRERHGDVPLLAQHLIERHVERAGHAGVDYEIDGPTLRAMERYPWPGNVRELENSIQRAIALAGRGRELKREHLLPVDGRWRGATEVAGEVRPLREVLRETERAHIQAALEQTGGHRTQTAELLGISRKVLWEKMRDLEIEAPGAEGGEGES